ncbi:thiamine phosphate synthase [Thalassospira sp.]|uniref:thiamine phosphate synthase n=1 Tax=Thalassospira sp. TaxID=1912094 RepID=UPI003AA857D1
MDKTLLKQARNLNKRNGRNNCPIPPIVLMTDDKRLPDPEPAIRALPGDSMVIFRHYDHPMRAELGACLRTICRARGILFLVADDVSLALRLQADGLHFPEYRALSDPGIYRRIPDHLLRTSACHHGQTIRHLAQLPRQNRPDGVLISPVFATKSHPDSAYLGLQHLSKMSLLCHAHDMQPIALGGIDGRNVGTLRTCAIASVAGIGFSVG